MLSSTPVDADLLFFRDALCSLILGSPAGKVYSKLRSVCSRGPESLS